MNDTLISKIIMKDWQSVKKSDNTYHTAMYMKYETEL